MYLLEKLELLHAAGGNSSEAILATYFINQTDLHRDEGIKNAALETEISKSSIIRFCQSAGFSGFSDFSQCLRQDLDEALLSFNPYPPGNSCELPDEKFSCLLSELLHTERIYFFGPRDFLQILSPCIRKLRKKRKVYTQRPFSALDQAILMTGIREKDLVILIEPNRTWRSLDEAGRIQQEMPVRFPSWKAKTVFLGAQEAGQAWLSWKLGGSRLGSIEALEELGRVLYERLEEIN